MLGATSHMGNNNRWAREGGVIDEIMVENVWRNPEGNAIIFDSLLLEWVTREPNITLLLNTAVHSRHDGIGSHIHNSRCRNKLFQRPGSPRVCCSRIVAAKAPKAATFNKLRA